MCSIVSGVREVLAGVRVGEFLTTERAPVLLHPGDPLEIVLNRLEAVPHAIVPVVDAQNHLLGVVNLEEVHLAATEPALPVVADLQQRIVLGMVRRYEIAGAYLRRLHGPASTACPPAPATIHNTHDPHRREHVGWASAHAVPYVRLRPHVTT
ncbi:MAG: CBS domain-containing protein [Planctomycetes bacterium]|nr:CBS domain-containing protein [Planctomycetota bacterium]